VDGGSSGGTACPLDVIHLVNLIFRNVWTHLLLNDEFCAVSQFSKSTKENLKIEANIDPSLSSLHAMHVMVPDLFSHSEFTLLFFPKFSNFSTNMTGPGMIYKFHGYYIHFLKGLFRRMITATFWRKKSFQGGLFLSASNCKKCPKCMGIDFYEFTWSKGSTSHKADTVCKGDTFYDLCGFQILKRSRTLEFAYEVIAGTVPNRKIWPL
jgi:hypothetical protein